MAFPTTGVLDDFNRSNVGPPPSASWTTLVTGHVVYSNQLRYGGADDCISQWNVATYGGACEVYATLAVLPGTGSYAEVWLRRVGDDFYSVYFEENASTDYVDILRYDDGSWTQLGADISGNFSAGNKLGLEANGSTLTAYKYSSGAWAAIGSRTDSTYSAAGALGITTIDTTVRLDDFGGGTIVTVTANTWYVFAQL